MTKLSTFTRPHWSSVVGLSSKFLTPIRVEACAQLWDLNGCSGNSKQYCKWCNMRPEKQHGKQKPLEVAQAPEEIDLFDIPIYAAMTQDQGNLDKQRLSDFIGRYF